MYFQCPLPERQRPACSTSGRARLRVPEQRRQDVLAVPSRVGASGSRAEQRRAKDARKSTWETSASETAGFTRAGQRTMNGTRVPPSKVLYLPPRNGPAGL